MAIFPEDGSPMAAVDDPTIEIFPLERSQLGARQEIQHFYVTCNNEERKVDLICNLYPRLVNTHCVIFVNTEKSIVLLAEKMGQRGYKIFTYQEGEVESLQKFCSECSGVLITMDMLPSNDFDFQASSVVVNYHVPSCPKDYICRQFGRVVAVFNFLTMYDWSILLVCQRLYNFSLVPFDWSTLEPMDTSFPPEDSQLGLEQDDFEMSDTSGYNGDDGFVSYDDVYESFEDMNLKEELRVRLYGYGFEKPSEVQQRGIVPLCKGLNMFVQAEPEPGKVVTFCSGIVQRCTNVSECQCIVIARAVDRAYEITRVLRELGAHLYFFKVYACGEGGQGCYDDLRYFDDRTIRRKIVHVVIGTADRVLDMLKKKDVSRDHINLVVLDEAEFTAFGIIDQIDMISQLLPSTVQVAVFSKIMSPAAIKATRVLCSRSEKGEPVKIVVKKNQDEATPLEGMTHFVVHTETYSEKPDLLGSLFDELHNVPQCIIFVDDVYSADVLLATLKKKQNVRAWVVRPYMDQSYREMAMRNFRDGSINVLITTSRLVPGFNIRGSLVINYDMTSIIEIDEYRERIAGFGISGGVTINFVDVNSWWHVLELHCLSGVHFEELPSAFAQMVTTG